MKRLWLLPVSLVALSFCGCSTAPSQYLQVGHVLSVQIAGGLPGEHLPPPISAINAAGAKDPAGEAVISKLVGWLNSSTPVSGETEYGKHGYPIIIRFNLKGGSTATVEPALNCTTQTTKDGAFTEKSCKAATSEVVFSMNNKKVRLKSPQVYDWLEGGWKQEYNNPVHY